MNHNRTRWGIAAIGLSAMVVLFFIAWLMISGDYPTTQGYSVWVFFLIFPIALPLAGSIMLVGVNDENREG